MMDKVGGINNATTSLDRTNYYENLPSDHLELAVEMEADRMRDLLLREEDRQPEMTVVRNEFERGENDPAQALEKEVMSAAFVAHPYHHPTIGWRSDIEKVSIAKLREFYDTFYWPNNATITVIGDFTPASALQLIGKYFGPIPRSPHAIPTVYTEEPAQTGARRVVVKRSGEVGAVQIAFKTPRALHPDRAPLEILSTLLSEGKTSRLYRALIDSNLAISADTWLGSYHDDQLFSFSSMLAPGVGHDRVERMLLDEIEKLKKDGVTPAEVTRAINQLVAAIAFHRDGSFAIAGQINEAISVGDWTTYATLLDQLKLVTAADVQRVARQYFNEDQSTTGWFIPQAEPAEPAKTAQAEGPKAAQADLTGTPLEGGGSDPQDAKLAITSFGRDRFAHFYRDPRGQDEFVASPRRGGPAVLAAAPISAGGGAANTALIAPRVHRRQVAGIDVLTLKTGIKDVITIRGVLGAGDVFNPPGNSAIADLTASMIDKGTTRRDKFAVAAVLEETGATLRFGTGTHTLNFSGKSLRKDLPLVVGLLAEQLRTPRFDAEEFAKLKPQLIGRHKRAMDDPDFRAGREFERALYPEGHPNRPPANEKYLADIEVTTIEQLRAFHAANYGPASARLVLVGDIDDAAVDAALTEAFKGWSGGRPIPPAPKAPALTAARVEKVAMPGKTSVSLTIGQPSGLRYTDPGYQALNLGTSVLGSGFFSARLLDIIRNREGLTYGIFAQLSGDTYADGAWQISATFAPELLEKGLASTVRELNRFAREGLTAEELKTFKVTLTGSYKVALATSDGLASTLLATVQRGYSPEWVDEYPRKIEALSLGEVNAAIKQFLNPDKMVTVMAGTFPDAKK
jgi:zinc protease